MSIYRYLQTRKKTEAFLARYSGYQQAVKIIPILYHKHFSKVSVYHLTNGFKSQNW